MISQGSDVTINITVTSTQTLPNGNQVTTPVDLTLYQGYVVFLYSEETPNVIIQKYSRHPATGYEPINYANEDVGRIQLWLDKEQTTDAPIGKIYAELKTSLADPNFSLSSFETVAVFAVDTIRPSVTNTINPPTI